MTIFASQILDRVRTILQDGRSVRWPLPELAKWLSDGLRELANARPSATTKKIVMALEPGTLQALPDGYGALLDATRNMTGSEPGRVATGVITIVGRTLLDAVRPNWHDPDRTPFTQIVKHVLLDQADPTAFYVYPGNDGTGQIEVLLSQIPADIEAIADEDPAQIEAYAVALPVLQSYQSALTDFVLYRALSKDMQFAGSAQRAQEHFAQFQAATAPKVAQ